jgi:hypothetical protein
MAVGDRVLHQAREHHVWLEPVSLGPEGFRLDGIRAGAKALDPATIKAALSFLLIEYLTIIGRLTAEVLTPALHEELRKTGHRARARDERA